MKKLACLLCAFSLSACGNSAKVDPPDYRPPQEQGEAQIAFQQRCLFSTDPALSGTLINNKTYCLRPLKPAFSQTNFTQSGFSGTYDFERAPAGSVVRGYTQDGPADAPQFFLDNTLVASGNVPITYLPRAGQLKLVIYGGFYRAINYSASFCFTRGVAEAPCPNPITP